MNVGVQAERLAGLSPGASTGSSWPTPGFPPFVAMTHDRRRRAPSPVATAAALAFGLVAGCTAETTAGAGATSDTDPSATGTVGGEVVVLSLSANSPFFGELAAGAQEAADEAGVELTVLDAQDDAATQADQLADAVVGNADAVIVNPVDPTTAAAAVQPVLDAGIPLVAVDRAIDGVEVTSYVGSDNVDGGRQAAAALAESVGFEGQVIHLEGITVTSASRERGQGFDEGLADTPGVDLVARQTADFARDEALDVTTTLLHANPDVVGIFAENDEMALGAIQALGDRAGTEVRVVGFGGTEPGLEAIAAGTMTSTIAQQPRELGAAGVVQAVAAVRGRPVQEVVPVPVRRVDHDDVGGR
ncbi:MAG: substrate-binding domain-containing protein [Actinomycetales bacterium]